MDIIIKYGYVVMPVPLIILIFNKSGLVRAICAGILLSYGLLWSIENEIDIPLPAKVAGGVIVAGLFLFGMGTKKETSEKKQQRSEAAASMFNNARLAAHEQKYDKAMRDLESAVDLGYSTLTEIQRDPSFQRLRDSNPNKFQKLMTKLQANIDKKG